MTSGFRQTQTAPSGRRLPVTTPTSNRDPAWWLVMGFDAGPPGSITQVESRFRQLAAKAHPDRGGNCDRMCQLVRARAEARVQLMR